MDKKLEELKAELLAEILFFIEDADDFNILKKKCHEARMKKESEVKK